MLRKQKIIQSRSKRFNKNKLNNKTSAQNSNIAIEHSLPTDMNNLHENANEEIADKVIENAVGVLVRLDTESRQENITPEEFGKRGMAMKTVLDKLEEDFGLDFMLRIFILAGKRLGRTPGPLDHQTIQKLLDNGFTLKNTEKAVSYEK